MSFDIEKFSYRLTVLLDENNMTQTQLAQKIGTSNVTICRYLTGERTPRIDVLTKIAYVFNVSLDYLLVKFSTFPSSIFDIYTCIFDVKDYLAQYTKVENNCNRIAPRTLKKLINELVTNQQIAHYTKTNYLYPKKEYDDVEYPDDLKEINILEWGKSCGLLYDNAVKDDLTFYDLFIEIKNNGYNKDQMYTFLNAEDSDIITICKSKLDMLVNRLL